MKVDLRIEAAELGKHQGKDRLASGMADSYSQLSAPVVADVIQLGGCLALYVQYLLGRCLELKPCVCKLQILLPFKELAAQFLLQSGYLVAQGLLGDVQPLCRTCDVAFRGGCEKVFEVLEIHGYMIDQSAKHHNIFIVETNRNKVFEIVAPE